MSNVKLIFEKGYEAPFNNFVPKMDIESINLDEILPKKYQRSEDIDIPDIPEFDIVRHYLNLSQKNYSLDNGFYPLARERNEKNY